MSSDEKNAELKILIFRRGQLKGQLTRFANFVENNDHDNVTELKIRVKKFEDMWDEFDKVQSSIELIDTPVPSKS